MTRVLLKAGTCTDCRCEFSALVGVPVFNAAPTIAEQLRSLAAQTATVPWLLVVADNGSTDDSVEVVQAFRDQFKHLTLVDASDRRGAAHARNVAAAQGRSRYVAFVDADDATEPDWLEQMMLALQKSTLVAGRLEHRLLNDQSVIGWRAGHQDAQAAEFEGIPYAVSANVGIRRALFESLGGFDETFPIACEDVDFSLRAHRSGAELGFATGAIVHYRHRGSFKDSLSQARSYGSASVDLFVTHRGFLPQLTLRSCLLTIMHIILSFVVPRLRAGTSRRMAVWSLAYHGARGMALVSRGIVPFFRPQSGSCSRVPGRIR